MKEFRELGLSEDLIKSLEELRFAVPSEIQKKVIPVVLAGKDVIGYSATGSGKTLAFGAGIVEKVKKGQGMQALILTPTRELCDQVAQSLMTFSKHHGLNIVEVYGGVSINPQIFKLRKCEIVVGTPGRVLDHMARRTLNLSKVHMLILDEADRMVDMGFLPDVEKIIRQCPVNRQTMLFSATSSNDIDYIKRKYMKNPIAIEAGQQVDPSKLKQCYYDVPSHMKFSLLVHLLKNDKSKLAMVFCNTKINTDVIARNLKNAGIGAFAIHGGLAQNKRNQIMQDFRDEDIKVLVCTDVAARGLDIKNVSHVYNYDSPKNSKEYIHRIGRTARAGEDGEAISIVSDRDYENFRKVYEDSTLTIKKIEVPEIQRVSFEFDRYGRGRSGGHRSQSRTGYGQSHGRGGQRNFRRFGNRNESYGHRRFGGQSRFNRDNRGEKDNRERSDNRSDRGNRFRQHRPHRAQDFF